MIEVQALAETGVVRTAVACQDVAGHFLAMRDPEPDEVDHGVAHRCFFEVEESGAEAFVVDQEGNVALRQVWVVPKKIREVLDELLAP